MCKIHFLLWYYWMQLLRLTRCKKNFHNNKESFLSYRRCFYSQRIGCWPFIRLVEICSIKTQWQTSLLTIESIDSRNDHFFFLKSNEDEEMSDVLVSRLEDLPIEMLIEIFQYLSVHELYFSFSSLNTHLNSIIKAFPNLILITTSHWDPGLSFFHSFGTVQVHFNYLTSSLLS